MTTPDQPKWDYTRAELVAICARAVVPLDKWSDRDTPNSQQRVGVCWALLRAGCEFKISPPKAGVNGCHTDERTIWVEVLTPTFWSIECGDDDIQGEWENFYLPTPARLRDRAGEDWY